MARASKDRSCSTQGRRPTRGRGAEPPPTQSLALRHHLLTKAVAARGLPLIVLGAIGYFVFIPFPMPDNAAMARLLPHHATLTALSTLSPTFDNSVTITSNAPSALRSAAKAAPDQTGSYSIEWIGPAAVGDSEELLVDILPDATAAAAVETQLGKLVLHVNSKAVASSALSGTLGLAGVHASGVTYPIPHSTFNAQGKDIASPNLRGATVVARTGRAVFEATLQTPSLTATAARPLVRSMVRALSSALPGLGSTRVVVDPLTATLIYSILAALVVLGVAWGPVAFGRQRQLRAEREAERQRYQYRARGAKNLRRHRSRARY